MSVDLVGTMRAPVRLDVLVTSAHEVLARLLGLKTPPGIEVIAGRRYDQGRLVDAGRRLSPDEMRSIMIGEHVRGPLFERPSTCHFEFETADGDGARLMEFDPCGLSDPDDAPEARNAVEACFSPHRTCAGVVMATALALAAAELGGGDFVDIEIMMLRPPVSRPDHVIELTRLPPDSGLDFAKCCEHYMRQFAHLNGWPDTVNLSDHQGRQ